MQILPQRGVLIACGCLVVVAAVWIDLGPIHRHHTADSVVMSLVSVQQWTPLYWEQDRLGMLFPLLAKPWRHPLDNLLALGAMTTLTGLASFFLLGCYVLGRTRGIAAGALGAIFLVGFCRSEQQFEHLLMLQQNAQALAIGIGGLVLLDRWARRGAIGWAMSGAACLAAAHWINPAIAFVIAPLLVLRGLCFRGASESTDQDDATCAGGHPSAFARQASWRERARPRRDEALGLIVVAASLAGSMVLSSLANEHSTYRILSFDEWLACAVEMYQHLHVYFHHRWFSATEITALVGLLTLALPAGRRAARVSLPMVAGLLLVAAVDYALMSSMQHVWQNHSARYIVLSALVWQAALVGFGVVQVGAVLPEARWTRALPLTLTLAMTLVVAARHGWPSMQVVRHELDQALGRCTDDILASDCTHVTGDYWHVWPAVFHTNLRLADQKSPRIVWGLAPRSGPTEPQWRNIPWRQARIAEIVGDESQAAENLVRYHVPQVVAGAQVNSIRVLELAGDWDQAAIVAARP